MSLGHLAAPSHPHRPQPAHHGAMLLNQRLHLVKSPTDLGAWGASTRTQQQQQPSEGRNGVISALQEHVPRLAMSIGSKLHPQGDNAHNDDKFDQRLVNVVTSLPFLAVGANMLRRHQTPEGRQYAASMLSVGVVATAYHASSGQTRKILRKLDYWGIAASSSFMVKALWPHKRWLRHTLAVSSLAIPFNPLAVSTVHALVMQTEFARQAVKHKHVQSHFKLHAATAALGALAFAVEDVLLERGFGHAHGIWHCLAAAGVATTGSLIEHKEGLRLQASDIASSKIRMRSCHDSAVSLDSLAGRKSG